MHKVTRNEKQFDFGNNCNNAYRHNTCLFIDMTLTTSDDMLHELTMQYTNICHYTSDLRINRGQDNNSQVLHILTAPLTKTLHMFCFFLSIKYKNSVLSKGLHFKDLYLFFGGGGGYLHSSYEWKSLELDIKQSSKKYPYLSNVKPSLSH